MCISSTYVGDVTGEASRRVKSALASSASSTPACSSNEDGSGSKGGAPSSGNIDSVGSTILAPADSAIEVDNTYVGTCSSITCFSEKIGSVSMGSKTLPFACCTSTGNGSKVDISGSDATNPAVISDMIFSASTGSGALGAYCIGSMVLAQQILAQMPKLAPMQ